MRDISLFIPCTVDLFLPEIGEATYQILRRLGLVPRYHREQTCCGQPAITAGYRKHAKKIAKHFLAVFEEDEYIVSPAGSCVATVKHHYPEILHDEPDWRRRAEELAPRVYELSQFLVDVLQATDLGTSFAGRVAYHESCHILRGLGLSEQPKALIRAVTGVELIPMEGATDCCGFGGEFALDYPDISEAMVETKVDNFLASGADLLILSEPGCLLNIGGYLSRNHPGKRAMHLANFLNQREG
ncbi:MAG: (Fe-S)-binding protein [Desulfuromonadales bacterium]|nr:(Fe-S)-binding protein [Desulfuromonadales bacterium]